MSNEGVGTTQTNEMSNFGLKMTNCLSNPSTFERSVCETWSSKMRLDPSRLNFCSPADPEEVAGCSSGVIKPLNDLREVMTNRILTVK
jgi:hypothetical protein